ncbi:hypothetical protein ACWN8V_07520 [Vagococcus elongatus]
MLREFAKFLQDQRISPEERIVIINNREFVVDNSGVAHEIEPINNLAKTPLEIQTLSGLVDYVQANKERQKDHYYIRIIDERTVELSGVLDYKGRRETLVRVDAIVPRIYFNDYLDIENLIITLQSKFVPTEDSKNILRLAGNIKEENVKNTGDDGVSQQVSMKTGVATVGEVKVPNPVILAPYRTFIEVEQPESSFIFRMKNGPVGAIFEADGGAWRNSAIANIHAYLLEELGAEIEAGRITLIA